MRVHVVGGFLGAGKTTLIRALASHLKGLGEQVAVITNDQGRSLVDTRLCLSSTDTVDEITGGCFCCRFDALDKALDSAQQAGATVVIAEAVGSCTDLVATVLSPLAQRRTRLKLAPLTIVVDPWRVSEMTQAANTAQADSTDSDDGGDGTDIAYLFSKQIQEADIVALSRSDLDPPDVRDAIRELAPHAAVVRIGFDSLPGLEDLLTAAPDRPATPLDIDYDRYARAEAALGWANARVRIENTDEFDPARVIEGFLAGLRDDPVAHVKIVTLEPEGGHASLVRQGARPSLNGSSLPEAVNSMTMLVNARVELPPSELETRLKSAMANSASPALVTWEEFDCFQPAPPTPTHRHSFRCGSGDDASCCAAFYDRDDVRFLLGDSWHPGGLDLTLDMAARLDLQPEHRLLDVACGEGTSLRAIQSQWSVKAVGLDADAGSDEAIEFRSGDAHELPFDDQGFDALLCECALSTFTDQERALCEMKRVLRPGGRLAISDMTVTGEIPESLRDWVHVGTCLQGALEFDGYASLIEKTGLRLIERRAVPEALTEMLGRIKRNLVGLAFSQAAAGVPREQRVDVALGRSLIREAEQAVAEGSIGYGVFVAERPS